MEKSDKQQLEGLLQARSEDLRHGRRAGRRLRVPTPLFEAPAPVIETPATDTTYSARHCEGCSAEISERRLRAMPRATRCLDCQRAAERTATAS